MVNSDLILRTLSYQNYIFYNTVYVFVIVQYFSTTVLLILYLSNFIAIKLPLYQKFSYYYFRL